MWSTQNYLLRLTICMIYHLILMTLHWKSIEFWNMNSETRTLSLLELMNSLLQCCACISAIVIRQSVNCARRQKNDIVFHFLFKFGCNYFHPNWAIAKNLRPLLVFARVLTPLQTQINASKFKNLRQIPLKHHIFPPWFKHHSNRNVNVKNTSAARWDLEFGFQVSSTTEKLT